MSATTLKYGADFNVLLSVSGSVSGHPFERDHCAAIRNHMEDSAATFADQPAASRLINPHRFATSDVLSLYHMSGINLYPADSALEDGLRSVLRHGGGVVALHHPIAGWTAWSEHGDWPGGRFLCRSITVPGDPCPYPEYRHDMTHTIRRQDIFHPIFLLYMKTSRRRFL